MTTVINGANDNIMQYHVAGDNPPASGLLKDVANLLFPFLVVVFIQLCNRGGNRHFDDVDVIASIELIGGIAMVLSIRCDKRWVAFAGLMTC